MVTSYCPDGLRAAETVLSAPLPLRVFYDLDTPVTLAQLQRGQATSYIGPAGLADYDLVLSYTGGGALAELRSRLGARHIAPLYGHVDPDVYRPSERRPQFLADLAYIGTYAQDRQAALQRLLLDVAGQCPERRFVIAGAQYPQDFPWSANILFAHHLPPDQHAAFYSSTRLLLNVTRQDMARMGWCPSGRLFEAAACGAAIISDWWPGLDAFFAPGEEVLIADTTDDVVAALHLPDTELRRLGANARRRVLAEHTSDRRAAELERVLSEARRQSTNVTAPMEA
jgi:spore maturation protein CgeB